MGPHRRLLLLASQSRPHHHPSCFPNACLDSVPNHFLAISMHPYGGHNQSVPNGSVKIKNCNHTHIVYGGSMLLPLPLTSQCIRVHISPSSNIKCGLETFIRFVTENHKILLHMEQCTCFLVCALKVSSLTLMTSRVIIKCYLLCTLNHINNAQIHLECIL